MKVEITKAQFHAVKSLIDEMEAMSGGCDEHVQKNINKNLLLAKRFLKKNARKFYTTS
jgi:hypothetical protein